MRFVPVAILTAITLYEWGGGGGRGVSWQVCRVESKVYLGEYDVEWVSGDVRTSVIVHAVTPVYLTFRHRASSI